MAHFMRPQGRRACARRQGHRRRVRAGVDSIEHGTFIDEQGVKDMKARGTYYVATLMAFSGVEGALGNGQADAGESEAKARQTLGVWGKGLNLAYRNGVKIALGTDSAVAPHTEANKELALMVSKGGMSPRDALIAATKGGPDLIGSSNETGTLDPGKSADLIAVEGDPLVDPTAVQHVDYVMVEGQADPDERTMMRSSLFALSLLLSSAAFAQQSSSMPATRRRRTRRPKRRKAKDKDKDEDTAKASVEEDAQPVRRSITLPRPDAGLHRDSGPR